MWDLQRADGFYGHREALIGAAIGVGPLQALARRPQDAKNPGPIEPLSLTVVAEAHMSSPSSIIVRGDGCGLGDQPFPRRSSSPRTIASAISFFDFRRCRLWR